MTGKHWPFVLTWHKGLWRMWDALTPDERLFYERRYEENQHAVIAAKMRGHINVKRKKAKHG